MRKYPGVDPFVAESVDQAMRFLLAAECRWNGTPPEEQRSLMNILEAGGTAGHFGRLARLADNSPDRPTVWTVWTVWTTSADRTTAQVFATQADAMRAWANALGWPEASRSDWECVHEHGYARMRTGDGLTITVGSGDCSMEMDHG